MMMTSGAPPQSRGARSPSGSEDVWLAGGYTFQSNVGWRPTACGAIQYHGDHGHGRTWRIAPHPNELRPGAGLANKLRSMQEAPPQALTTISVYRREEELVWIETRQAAVDPCYFLTCRHPDGTTQTETFDNSEQLYERLRSLRQKLSWEGWIPLPRERRELNRLSVPLCSPCGSSEAVRVLARTDADVHFGCATCGALWSVPKPGARLPP
jgi:hypothetical protein